MTSTTFAISSTAAFDYYEPMSYVAKQLQNDTSDNMTLRFDALFSKPIYNETVNYIESTLAFKEAYTLDNHAGIEWYDGNQMYYVFLREDKIGISSQQIDNEFMSLPIERQLGTWYTIKILYSDGMINIFLNGSLRMQVPSDSNPEISKVGIRSHNTITEFQPLEIATAIPPRSNIWPIEYNILDFINSNLGDIP